MQILDIFLLFGAPNILQSDNGAEFTVSIISQLSPVLIFEIISSGKEDEVRPTFVSTPNIALCGVRLIPRMVAKVFLKLHTFYDDLKDITNTGVRNDFDIIEITDEISGTGNTESVTCIVCQKPASNAHSCSKCSNTVHVICGKTNGEEGFGRSFKSMSHKTLYKEEVINTFIYFYKQDLDYCTFVQPFCMYIYLFHIC
jgi:hypothetical protein